MIFLSVRIKYAGNELQVLVWQARKVRLGCGRLPHYLQGTRSLPYKVWRIFTCPSTRHRPCEPVNLGVLSVWWWDHPVLPGTGHHVPSATGSRCSLNRSSGPVPSLSQRQEQHRTADPPSERPTSRLHLALPVSSPKSLPSTHQPSAIPSPSHNNKPPRLRARLLPRVKPPRTNFACLYQRRYRSDLGLSSPSPHDSPRKSTMTSPPSTGNPPSLTATAAGPFDLPKRAVSTLHKSLSRNMVSLPARGLLYRHVQLSLAVFEIHLFRPSSRPILLGQSTHHPHDCNTC